MTTNRRDFIARTSLALAGGLLVGDAALEAFERLTHRKVWALGGLAALPRRVLYIDVWERLPSGEYKYWRQVSRTPPNYAWRSSGLAMNVHMQVFL